MLQHIHTLTHARVPDVVLLETELLWPYGINRSRCAAVALFVALPFLSTRGIYDTAWRFPITKHESYEVFPWRRCLGGVQFR